MKHIEITFRLADGRYVFASADKKIFVENADREKVAARFVRLLRELTCQGMSCRVEAYVPLGPSLKMLRDAGAICRVGLHDSQALKSPRWQMPGMPGPDPPPPVFLSWPDYLARTSRGQRMTRCHAAAKKANRKRLLSDAAKFRLRGQDVWAVIETARGRCAHCGSLAVENRPSNPITGAPLPWAQIGRRIGSLEHVRWRFGGGDNDLSNLAWSCLWCNTWRGERRSLATDHGGFYPADETEEASSDEHEPKAEHRRLSWVPQWPDDAIVWIDVGKLNASWRGDKDYVGSGGNGGIGDRYERFGRWLAENGKPIWMPRVNFNNLTGWMIGFTDGRHRFAWLRDHGAKNLPITTDPMEVAEIRKRFGTRGRTSWIRNR